MRRRYAPAALLSEIFWQKNKVALLRSKKPATFTSPWMLPASSTVNAVFSIDLVAGYFSVSSQSNSALLKAEYCSRRILCPAPLIYTHRNGSLDFQSFAAFSAVSLDTMPFSEIVGRVGCSIAKLQVVPAPMECPRIIGFSSPSSFINPPAFAKASADKFACPPKL